MLTRVTAAFLVFTVLTSPVAGAPTACPQHFAAGGAPTLINEKLVVRTRELCNTAFAVLHSGVTRTPLWAAEHLTRDSIRAARQVGREGQFHADPRLPEDERAELADYRRSGFDRGHLAPAGDMPSKQAQDESFSLANMIPQNSQNNRGLWSEIEEAVRDLALKGGDLYVITGPIFAGANLQRIHGRVLVPTHVFKAVHDARQGKAAAYVAENAPGTAFQRLSIPDLEGMIGIAVFPGLPEVQRNTMLDLPDPYAPGRAGGRKKAD